MLANILIIEDDEMKLQAILNVISRQCPSANVEKSYSVRKAIDTLASEKFDLIIADMSLPTFNIGAHERGGTPRPFGGIEIFEYLQRVQSITPVLVVTSYPVLSDGKKSVSFSDLKTQLCMDFPENFSEIIYFDSTYTDWERDIRKFMSIKFG